MSLYLYNLVPTLSGFLLVLLFRFSIYRKSISTFIGVFGLIVISNLMHYGYIDAGLILIPTLSLGMILRVMFKSGNDKFLHRPHDFSKLTRRYDDKPTV